MKKLICDRCGNDIVHISEKPDFPELSLFKIYSPDNIARIDLCDNCRHKFLAWLDEEER